MSKKDIVIDGVKIGPSHKPYIVAELSANHNGSLELALETIEKAKACGADAIKLQTYTADTMTIDCKLPDFQIESGPWAGNNLYDLYVEAQTPFEWHKAMFEKAKEIGLTCFSTPFDESAVDLLEEMGAPAYKIASFEAIDLPLIRYAAKTGKPLIISTGMATKEEIAEAVQAARDGGCQDLILLHCISGYPVPFEEANLQTIKALENEFDVHVGLSDHTLGTATSVASIPLGACFIEKHFILDRNLAGPDSHFSIEPEELVQLCEHTKFAHQAIGKVNFDKTETETGNLRFRRSIYVVKDIKKGDVLTEDNIRRIRPGFGLPPKHFEAVIGKSVNTDLKRGTALAWEHIND